MNEMQLPQELYPYLDNPTNDEAIRLWNYRMHDKREAYMTALKLFAMNWDSDADFANQVFGDRYGIDWKYRGDNNALLNKEALTKLLHTFWQRSSDACPLEVGEAEQQEKEWKQFILENF